MLDCCYITREGTNRPRLETEGRSLCEHPLKTNIMRIPTGKDENIFKRS